MKIPILIANKKLKPLQRILKQHNYTWTENPLQPHPATIITIEINNNINTLMTLIQPLLPKNHQYSNQKKPKRTKPKPTPLQPPSQMKHIDPLDAIAHEIHETLGHPIEKVTTGKNVYYYRITTPTHYIQIGFYDQGSTATILIQKLPQNHDPYFISTNSRLNRMIIRFNKKNNIHTPQTLIDLKDPNSIPQILQTIQEYTSDTQPPNPTKK